jgi:hypothetical protein
MIRKVTVVKLPGDDTSYDEPPAWLKQMLAPRNRISHITDEDLLARIDQIATVVAYVCWTCLRKQHVVRLMKYESKALAWSDMMHHCDSVHGWITLVSELSFNANEEIKFIHPPRYQCLCCKKLFTRLIDVPTHVCPLVSENKSSEKGRSKKSK